jgi:hypothetical protein
MFTGLWLKLLAGLAAIGGIAAVMFGARKSGADAQKVKQAEATDKVKRKVADAIARGAHTDDAVDRKLRDGTF